MSLALTCVTHIPKNTTQFTEILTQSCVDQPYSVNPPIFITCSIARVQIVKMYVPNFWLMYIGPGIQCTSQERKMKTRALFKDPSQVMRQ